MQVSSNSLGDTASTMKTIKRIASATLLVSGFCLFAGTLSNTLNPTQAEGPGIIDIAPLSGGSLSLTSSNAAPCTSFNTSTNQLNVDVQRGGIASDCIAIAVSTDGNYGYTLSIEGPSTGDLTTSTNETIGATTGTIVSPAVFTNLFSQGAWGFAVPNGQIQGFDFNFDNAYSVLAENNTVNTARFARVPTNPTPISFTDGPNTTPDTYHIFFAISAGANMPTGDYSGVVTISAVSNTTPPVLLLMQEITHANCPTVRTMAVDARDNRSYWVQRLDDGRCWMLTNLAYGGGGDNTFNDVVSLNQGTQGDSTAPLFAIPPGANPTDFPQAPSTATDGGVNLATAQFGYLYNWCAAMGGQPAACQTTTFIPPNNNINICPAGWRVPTTSDFQPGLRNAVNSGVSNTDAGFLANWLSMRSGQFRSGSFSGQGAVGRYWLTDALIVDPALGSVAVIEPGDVYWENDGDDGSGFAVRCVANPPPPPRMQEVTLANCPTTRTMAVDARDNRTYWIRRIGNACWMETNLAYAGGGNNQFGDVRTLTQGIIGTNTAAGQVCNATNASLPLGESCFFIPTGANPTTYPAMPSPSTSGTGQFGYLYDFCAAAGGQALACQTGTVGVQPTPAISVCPAGWRLPTGGDFSALNNAVNSGATNTDLGLRTNWLAMRAGGFSSGVFNGQGTNANFRSGALSTPGTGLSAITMTINATSVSPIVNSPSATGSSVRCIRDS